MRCSEGTAGLIARIWGRWTTRVLVLVCFSRSHPSSGGGLAEAQRCLDDSFHWSEVPGFPAPSAKRHLQLEKLNWASQILVTEVASILLEETLGISVNFTAAGGSVGVYDRVGAGPADASLEIWNYAENAAARDRWKCRPSCTPTLPAQETECVNERTHKFGGDEMLFVARAQGATAHDTELALLDHWASYTTNAANLARLPPADFLVADAPTLPCHELYCSADGRFYPSVCGGDRMGRGTRGNASTAAAAGCRAVFAAFPDWSFSGYMALQFEVRNMPLVITFVGDVDNMKVYNEAAFDAGYDVSIFYSFVPNTYVARLKPATLHLPSLRQEFCIATPDWGGNCLSQSTGYGGTSSLRKVFSSRVAALSDAAVLFELLEPTASEINDLLAEHAAGPHNATERDAACAWLRNNSNAWATWVDTAQQEAVRAEVRRASSQNSKTNVSIGVMVAQRDGSPADNAYLQAVELAVADVNNDDTLLSGFNVGVVRSDISQLRALSSLFADTGVASSAFVRLSEATRLVEDLQGSGVIAVIGAGYSSDVEVLASPLFAADIPLISQSATKSTFSDKVAFPGFARMASPDNQEATAVASLLAHFSFEWTTIGVVHCNDAYCKGYLQDLQNELAKRNRKVDFFVETTTDIDMREANILTEKIGLKLQSSCDAVDVEPKKAITFVVVHNASVLLTEEFGGTLQTDWLASSTTGSSMRMLSRSFLSQHRVLAATQKTDLAHARVAALEANIPLMWQNPYVLNAYDGVQALARAMDAVHRSNADNALQNGTALLTKLRDVRFSGPSGAVAFDMHLDRIADFAFLGFSPAHGDVRSVAEWTPDGPRIGSDISSGDNTPCAVLPESAEGFFVAASVVGAALLIAIIICVWKRRINKQRTTHLTTFISHSKRDGGDYAATLVQTFNKALLRSGCCCGWFSSAGPNFLDVEQLGGGERISAEGLVSNVKKSKVFVLILTRSVLTRPWCLVEIYTALAHGIPFVPVLIKDPNRPHFEYSFGKAAQMLRDLENVLLKEETCQEMWGESAWTHAEIDAIGSVKTATHEELEQWKNDPTRDAERSITVATPKGGRLTLQVIQDCLGAELGSQKAEEYNPQAALLVQRAQLDVIVRKIRKALSFQSTGTAGDLAMRSHRTHLNGWNRVRKAVTLARVFKTQEVKIDLTISEETLKTMSMKELRQLVGPYADGVRSARKAELQRLALSLRKASSAPSCLEVVSKEEFDAQRDRFVRETDHLKRQLAVSHERRDITVEDIRHDVKRLTGTKTALTDETKQIVLNTVQELIGWVSTGLSTVISPRGTQLPPQQTSGQSQVLHMAGVVTVEEKDNISNP